MNAVVAEPVMISCPFFLLFILISPKTEPALSTSLFLSVKMYEPGKGFIEQGIADAEE